MKQILLVIFSLVAIFIYGQNPKGFDKMVDGYVSGSVTLVQPSDCDNENIIFLDAREIEEYEVSHIKDAIYIGYDDFDITKLDTFDKNTKLVVYCSIGYRSEKIGEQLLNNGFKDVSNLYGGIFNWANSGREVFSTDQKTSKVHGYSRSWSKWLNEDVVTVVTGKKK